MAIFYVDTNTTSTYWQSLTPIDGREYLLTFRWNQRASAWYLDVADQDGVAIVYGLRLVCGIPLGIGVIDTRWWPGTLFCLSTTQDDSDPGLTDLGQRVLLIYDDGQPIAP